jgi:hypothetical protein
MLQRFLAAVLFAAFFLAATPAAFGQAAVSYGVAASKSAGTTAAAGKKMGDRTRKAAKDLDRRISRATVPSMEQNRRKLAEAAGDSPRKLKVESVPEKALVMVDGEPVGRTPLEVDVPEGTHRIRVAAAGYEPWVEDAVVEGDGEVALKADLKRTHQSSVTISFDD